VRVNFFERRMSRFLNEPVSVRGAVGVIVSATVILVGVSGFAVSLLDHREFDSFGLGVWWALQTVTTVGYGDVTPHDVAGRIVAGVVMIEGIALLSIVTAAVTSTFVQRADQSRASADTAEDLRAQEREDARFDEITARLERLESMLRTLTNA
jgi:voltage-gated potassium channel